MVSLYQIISTLCLLVFALHEVTSEGHCGYTCNPGGSCAVEYNWCDGNRCGSKSGSCSDFKRGCDIRISVPECTDGCSKCSYEGSGGRYLEIVGGGELAPVPSTPGRSPHAPETTDKETCTYICRNDRSCQIKYHLSDNGYWKRAEGNCNSYGICALENVPRCNQDCCFKGVGTHTENVGGGGGGAIVDLWGQAGPGSISSRPRPHPSRGNGNNFGNPPVGIPQTNGGNFNNRNNNRGNGGGNGGNLRCNYNCQTNGGCEVSTPPGTHCSIGSICSSKGSCFPPDFGGKCDGTPAGCRQCDQVCYNKSPGQYFE